ncbi:MAG: hypothetical protein ACI8WB_004894 [Phenylobacterium sp.]|jgi:hypothetical protein
MPENVYAEWVQPIKTSPKIKFDSEIPMITLSIFYNILTTLTPSLLRIFSSRNKNFTTNFNAQKHQNIAKKALKPSISLILKSPIAGI